MADTSHDRHPSRRSPFLLRLLHPKVAIPLSLVLALLLSPFAYRGYRISQVPNIGDPFDVEAFRKIEIPANENAATDYRAAMAALVSHKATAGVDFGVELDKAFEEGWDVAHSNLHRWLEDNQPALKLWLAGTKKPHCMFESPKTLTFYSTPEVSGIRTLARLITLEAMRLGSTGELTEAWKWHLAACRFSNHLGEHGVFIDRLLGIAVQAISAEQIVRWAQYPEVTAAMLRTALNDLQTAAKQTPLNTAVLEGEYVAVGNEDFDWDEFADGRLEQAAMWVSGEPQFTLLLNQLWYKNWLTHIDKPRHARPPRTGILFDAGSVGGLVPKDVDKLIASSMLAPHLAPSVSQFADAVDRAAARQQCLIISLAAQFYHREHGEFPASLSDLKTSGLEHIPLDPMASTARPMNYRRDGEDAIVWSIGEDGVDDGGKIESKSGVIPDMGYRIVSPQRDVPSSD